MIFFSDKKESSSKPAVSASGSLQQTQTQQPPAVTQQNKQTPAPPTLTSPLQPQGPSSLQPQGPLIPNLLPGDSASAALQGQALLGQGLGGQTPLGSLLPGQHALGPGLGSNGNQPPLGPNIPGQASLGAALLGQNPLGPFPPGKSPLDSTLPDQPPLSSPLQLQGTPSLSASLQGCGTPGLQAPGLGQIPGLGQVPGLGSGNLPGLEALAAAAAGRSTQRKPSQSVAEMVKSYMQVSVARKIIIIKQIVLLVQLS